MPPSCIHGFHFIAQVLLKVSENKQEAQSDSAESDQNLSVCQGKASLAKCLARFFLGAPQVAQTLS